MFSGCAPINDTICLCLCLQHTSVISWTGRAAGGQAPINNAGSVDRGKQGTITEEDGEGPSKVPAS